MKAEYLTVLAPRMEDQDMELLEEFGRKYLKGSQYKQYHFSRQNNKTNYGQVESETHFSKFGMGKLCFKTN